MHITITGKLGSGKSTVCKLIAEKHGFEIFSTGAIQREVARELGITPLELNLRMEEDHSLDDRLDSTVARLSVERKDDNLIFDSRMAWHFASDVFKIFVTVDPMTAAARVMANPRPEEPYASVEDACAGLIERSRVEQARFLALYGVDYYDFNNHNLIVDSTNRTPEEIEQIVWESFLAYQQDPVANAHREFL